ncbi:MAG: rhodanese-like domain-containing protein [Paracoccaceae bacterium]
MAVIGRITYRALLLAILTVFGSVGVGFAEARDAAKFQVIKPEPVQQQVFIPPLLGPTDLKNLMAVTQPYLLDIRSESALRARFSYEKGHIPESVNVPYGQWRSLWNDPLSVPSDEQLTELMQSSGLTYDRPIVIVHSSAAKGNFGSAAFVYWTLKSAGFDNMAILNGGIQGWKDIGGTVSTQSTEIVRSDVVVQLDQSWLATHEDVDAVLDGTSTAQLLDARPIKQIMKDASLDGSFTLNAEELVTGDGATAASDQSIFMRIKKADLDWEFNDVITYCNNGALAAVDWFMASEIAEIPNVRVYAHSLKARARAERLRQSRPVN